MNQRPTSGPSAFPIHPPVNFLQTVQPSHNQANSASQPIYLNFPIPTSGTNHSSNYDQQQQQLIVSNTSGDLQPTVFKFRAVHGQGQHKLMPIHIQKSTSTNNLHNISQNRISTKPAHRTKSLSTNDSTLIPQMMQIPQQPVPMHEQPVNIAIEPQNMHRKLDKSNSLPIYAQQTTLPTGATITALPGYVFAAPAPTAVQLTPFYPTMPGSFIQPGIPYGIPTVSPVKPNIAQKRHKASTTNEDMSSNQKQVLGPLA